MAGRGANIRSIDDPKYEEILKDCATMVYYEWNPAFFTQPTKIEMPKTGHKIWKSEYAGDAWDDLIAAVCQQAVYDYIKYYRSYQKRPTQYAWFAMKQIESDFFFRYDAAKTVYDEMMRRLKAPGSERRRILKGVHMV